MTSSEHTMNDDRHDGDLDIAVNSFIDALLRPTETSELASMHPGDTIRALTSVAIKIRAIGLGAVPAPSNALAELFRAGIPAAEQARAAAPTINDPTSFFPASKPTANSNQVLGFGRFGRAAKISGIAAVIFASCSAAAAASALPDPLQHVAASVIRTLTPFAVHDPYSAPRRAPSPQPDPLSTTPITPPVVPAATPLTAPPSTNVTPSDEVTPNPLATTVSLPTREDSSTQPIRPTTPNTPDTQSTTKTPSSTNTRDTPVAPSTSFSSTISIRTPTTFGTPTTPATVALRPAATKPAALQANEPASRPEATKLEAVNSLPSPSVLTVTSKTTVVSSPFQITIPSSNEPFLTATSSQPDRVSATPTNGVTVNTQKTVEPEPVALPSSSTPIPVVAPKTVSPPPSTTGTTNAAPATASPTVSPTVSPTASSPVGPTASAPVIGPSPTVGQSTIPATTAPNPVRSPTLNPTTSPNQPVRP